MKRAQKITFSAVWLCTALAISPASSQGFLDRGKELLKGFGGSEPSSGMSALTSGEIARGLREALRIGSGRVVSTLGMADGFNKAGDVHIPLPDTLKTVQSMLAKVGKGSMANDENPPEGLRRLRVAPVAKGRGK